MTLQLLHSGFPYIWGNFLSVWRTSKMIKTLDSKYSLDDWDILEDKHSGKENRVHTEWQWPLYGMHDGKISLAWWGRGGGGERPPPFAISIIMYKVSCSVRSSWEGRYTLPISTLPLYVLSGREDCMERIFSWRIGCRISRLPDNGFRLLTSGFFMNQFPLPLFSVCCIASQKIVFIFYFLFAEIVEFLGGSFNRCQSYRRYTVLVAVFFDSSQHF